MTPHSSHSRRLWTCTTAFFPRMLPVSSLSSTRSLMGNDVLSPPLHALLLAYLITLSRSGGTKAHAHINACTFSRGCRLFSLSTVQNAFGHIVISNRWQLCVVNPNKSPGLFLWSSITAMTHSVTPTQTLRRDAMAWTHALWPCSQSWRKTFWLRTGMLSVGLGLNGWAQVKKLI